MELWKEYSDEKQIKEIMDNIAEKEIIRTTEKEFESEHYGKITYIQIILKRSPQLPKRKRGLLDYVNRRLIRLSDDIPTPFDD